MKFNVEIKYFGEPAKYDEKNNKVFTYMKEYKISHDGNYIDAMRKELMFIKKKEYKGLYSIRFYTQ